MPTPRRIPPNVEKAFPELLDLDRLDRVELLARKIPQILDRALAGEEVHA